MGYSIVDIDWAQGRLEAYLEICRLVREAVPVGEYWNDTASRWNHEAELQLYAVEKIVRIADPSIDMPIRPPNYSMSGESGEEKVRRALGALRDRAEVQHRLAPEAPELVADQLHPTVWQAAAPTWDTGVYRVSVEQAALSLATHIKTRGQSKLTDRRLMQDVFAPDLPKPGSTRLHFPGDRLEETWKSRQSGLHQLAQGAYAGIRNVAAHDDSEWAENEAIEYLAVLSVVARWAETTNPVTGT